MSRTERHNIFTGSKTVTADLSTGTAMVVTRRTVTHHAEGNATVRRDEQLGELRRAAVKDGHHCHRRVRYGTVL